MSGDRPSALVLGCLGLMLAGFTLGVVLLVVMVIPSRQTDPIAAGVSLVLALVSFALAGAGAVLAVLGRRP